MMTYAHFCPFWLQRNRRDEAVFKPRFLCLTSPPGAISPSQDCYFINNSYGNEGQGRTRFSHKLDVAMNVSLCLPWPCCGIRHCLLGPEGQTQRKKWKASTFLHGTQRQQRKGEREGEKTKWTPSLFVSQCDSSIFSKSPCLWVIRPLLKLRLHCLILI